MCRLQDHPWYRDLMIDPSGVTHRSVDVCSGDHDHQVVEDGYASWNPLLQKVEPGVHPAQNPRAICNTCDEQVEDASESFTTEQILAAYRDEQKFLLGEINHELRRRTAPPVHMRCYRCGSDQVLFSSYNDISPDTGTGSVSVTFEKGHVCLSCYENARGFTGEILNSEGVQERFGSLAGAIPMLSLGPIGDPFSDALADNFSSTKIDQVPFSGHEAMERAANLEALEVEVKARIALIEAHLGGKAA